VTSFAIQEAGGESTSNGNSDTPKRPKKRPRRPEHWEKNVAKAKRAKGEAYISPSTGKEVPARETRPACKCWRKCYEAFSDAERGDLLQQFNDLGNKYKMSSHPLCAFNALIADHYFALDTVSW
jgi:hypothetical protein